MSDNIFEKAARSKLRFPSVRGELSVEQLWELPLMAKTEFDLDSVAKEVNSALREVTSESFVQASSPKQPELELKLEIVKHVIATRQAEKLEASKRAERLAERAKLIDLLGEKHDDELKGLTKEQLKARINELDGVPA